MKNSLIAIVLVLTVFSCKKQDFRSELELKWQNCREVYDQASTLEKMQGRWKYIAFGCGECSISGVQKVNENVEILLTADNKISTYKDGLLVKTSSFKLATSYNEKFFTLETIPLYENTYTHGIIEFCQGTLAFRNSYVDGGDYYFEEIK